MGFGRDRKSDEALEGVAAGAAVVELDVLDDVEGGEEVSAGATETKTEDSYTLLIGMILPFMGKMSSADSAEVDTTAAAAAAAVAMLLMVVLGLMVRLRRKHMGVTGVSHLKGELEVSRATL